ncbi:hypothetical protein ABTZ93_41210, partial [Streptomyces sp. NPDC097941]
MTETLTPPTTTVGADSPLALLFDIALEIGTLGEDEQREDAKTAALHHIWSHYPDTLGKAVDEDDRPAGRPCRQPDSSRAPLPTWTAACGCTTDLAGRAVWAMAGQELVELAADDDGPYLRA